MRTSLHTTIAKKIEKRKKGSLVFPSDFHGLGSYGAIRVALSRLTADKKLERLSQGIYMIPDYSPLIGLKYPSLEEIAHSIAKRDHARIQPAGTTALLKLGLSTQVPMRLVYLTDGTPRKIKVGKASILFKKISPRKLALKGKISGLVVQALDELGAKNITDEIISRIKEVITKEDPALLEQDIKIAPTWIGNLLLNIKPI